VPYIHGLHSTNHEGRCLKLYGLFASEASTFYFDSRLIKRRASNHPRQNPTTGPDELAAAPTDYRNPAQTPQAVAERLSLAPRTETTRPPTLASLGSWNLLTPHPATIGFGTAPPARGYEENETIQSGAHLVRYTGWAG
jgi:hypothetical protein